ncbi:hypothetical protein FCM35_KLT04939 [Carex littledalei]|uniref:Uncharacterized protein n=1 Tax=Carex littledalei TaxID=544730 RepID=A0A833VNU2_9POAL|nr:hypothetical protein FCM35_KLT04939 [Carex littledalei]
MWRQYIRAVADDPAKRVPPGSGSYGGGGGMFRRYSPTTTCAVAGLLVAGTIGYFMFYDKSRASKRHGVREYDRNYPTGPPMADRDRNVGTK